MRGIRTTGLCLIVGFIVGAAAASASAEAPSFGRCLKTKDGEGLKYTSAKCTVVATGEKENFEWYLAFGSTRPLEKAGFTTAIEPATVAALTTVAGTKITCMQEGSGGMYTSNKTVGGVVLKFAECETGGGKCNSAGKGVGQITWNELDGSLGVWRTGETAAKDAPGISLSPTTGEKLVEFACAGLSVQVKGAIILPVPGNAMKLSTKVKLTAHNGKQKPEQFVGGPQEVLKCKFSAAPEEQCALTLAMTWTNEEKVEASTVL
jgi:hypothetical protein